MNTVFYVLLFFMGACFVSCGNCIYYRVVRDMDWIHGRSVCEGCGKQLRVWELVPVVSCLILRGRCPRCGCYFGYDHAETEAVGGFMVVLLCLDHDTFYSCLRPLAVFGLVYCTFCWVNAKRQKNKPSKEG